MDTKRLNINIPVDILSKVDEYAESLCLNRTSAVIVLLNQGLEYKKSLEVLSDLVNQIKSSNEEL